MLPQKDFDCLKCRGRLWCGPRCPILEKHSKKLDAIERIPDEFIGSSPPSLFVSHYTYPKVSVAPLSPPRIVENAEMLDFPEKWFGLPAEEIIAFRETLVRAKKEFKVSDAASPSYELTEIQETALSSKPVEVEISLSSRPTAGIAFSNHAPPMGPAANMKSFALQENPSVPKKIDYIASDTDTLSTTALQELHDSKVPVSHLYKLLSAGLLGIKKQRKLVPTRWSITAVDSNISQKLVDKIKYFPQLGETMVFTSAYLDNYYYVMLYPNSWEFEQLEAWKPGTMWTSGRKEPTILADHEFYKGRTKYVEEIAGAYYSSRLAVAEYLSKIKRQAGCIIFREIGKGYDVPLGVWQVRENVRNALLQKPAAFSDFNSALAHVSAKLTIPLQYWEKKSKLLDSQLHQQKLARWSAPASEDVF